MISDRMLKKYRAEALKVTNPAPTLQKLAKAILHLTQELMDQRLLEKEKKQ